MQPKASNIFLARFRVRSPLEVLTMSGFFRTALMLAAMTALFMGVGYLAGGQTGMLIAFFVAAAMNLFA